MKKLWPVLVLIAAVLYYSSVSIAQFASFQYKDIPPVDSTWTCIRSLASGTCGGATAQYFDGSCDGSGSGDPAAFSAWVVYGVGRGASDAKLYVPPGSDCVLDGTGTNGAITFDAGVHNTPGIQKPTIYMKGATIRNVGVIGGWGFSADMAFIATAAISDTSVTLLTAADASNFSVGDWIVVGGLDIQGFGFPPNYQFFEFKQITSITGTTTKVVNFVGGLRYTYKSTWPLISGTGLGPAAIHRLEPSWNTQTMIIGGSLTNGAQIVLQGLGVTIIGTNFDVADGVAPSVSKDTVVLQSAFFGAEVDKIIDNLTFNNVRTKGIIDTQSASVTTLNIINSQLGGAINGTPLNISVADTNVPSGIRAGSTCCGRSNSVTLNNVVFNTALAEFKFSNISNFSFSGGTLTAAKGSATIALWVPGYKYFIGDTDGSNSCSPASTFTVSDVVDAGANIQIITDIVSIPTGNICNNNTRPPSTFGAYQARSLSVTNSGPANLLSNSEMLQP